MPNWDERYRQQGYVFGEAPNAFLASLSRRFKPGWRALAPGDGEGRNGVYLAQLGLQVLSVDASAVALEKALRLSGKLGARLLTLQADLSAWEPPAGSYDLVACIFLHLPPDLRVQVHGALVRCLSPGGMLVLEAFHPDQLPNASGGPKDPALLYTPEMMRRDFAGLTLERCERADIMLEEGPGHHGPAVVTRVVGVKR